MVKTASIPAANTAITRNVTDLTEPVLLAVHMDSMDKNVTKKVQMYNSRQTFNVA